MGVKFVTSLPLAASVRFHFNNQVPPELTKWLQWDQTLIKMDFIAAILNNWQRFLLLRSTDSRTKFPLRLLSSIHDTLGVI